MNDFLGYQFLFEEELFVFFCVCFVTLKFVTQRRQRQQYPFLSGVQNLIEGGDFLQALRFVGRSSEESEWCQMEEDISASDASLPY